MKPKVLILTGYGINSEEETAFVFNQTGSESEIVHINDLIDGHKNLGDYQIMAFPGGFSYSDDTGSGNALANKIRNNLTEQILNFAKADKLVIGICNGFQMLTNLGLVPGFDGNYGEQKMALMHNNTTRHQCRWIHMKASSQKCVWTRDINIMHLPISHGEGNFYCEPEVLKRLQDQDQIAFTYCHPDGSPANGQFPTNPNGALADIGGICDESGRIFGMMPHPERFNSFTNEDGWELKKEALIREGKEIPTQGAGLKIFENAANYFS